MWLGYNEWIASFSEDNGAVNYRFPKKRPSKGESGPVWKVFWNLHSWFIGYLLLDAPWSRNRNHNIQSDGLRARIIVYPKQTGQSKEETDSMRLIGCYGAIVAINLPCHPMWSQHDPPWDPSCVLEKYENLYLFGFRRLSKQGFMNIPMADIMPSPNCRFRGKRLTIVRLRIILPFHR